MPSGKKALKHKAQAKCFSKASAREYRIISKSDSRICYQIRESDSLKKF